MDASACYLPCLWEQKNSNSCGQIRTKFSGSISQQTGAMIKLLRTQLSTAEGLILYQYIWLSIWHDKLPAASEIFPGQSLPNHKFVPPLCSYHLTQNYQIWHTTSWRWDGLYRVDHLYHALGWFENTVIGLICHCQRYTTTMSKIVIVKCMRFTDCSSSLHMLTFTLLTGGQPACKRYRVLVFWWR